MGDNVDIIGDNSIVVCFNFLLSRKLLTNFGKRLRVYFRKICRHLRVMESFNDDIVNRRAGHVAVNYRQDSIVVWGGYKENDEEDNVLPHEYWPSSQICLYNYIQKTWKVLETSGEIPPLSSGSTAISFHNELYIFFGFYHYPKHSPLLKTDDDLDDDERALGRQTFVERNSNSVYVLNMETLLWKKLKPSGILPLRVDKLSSWVFDGKVFLFGGFGPPPDPSRSDLPNHAVHTVDPSTMDWHRQNIRGWTNQLVVYNITANAWEWPVIIGDIPSPRAAHSCVANSQGDAFLFGGRHGNNRLNDLYHLNLRRNPLRWTALHPCISSHMRNIFPVGRSWHTLTLVDDVTGILYGGYDLRSNPLGDCWKVDLRPGIPSNQRWTRLRHHEVGDLLWHCSVTLPGGQVYLLGGVRNDILNRLQGPIRHPRRVTILSISPPSLLVLSLEAAVRNYRVLKTMVPCLPITLKSGLEERRKKYIYDRDNLL